MSQTSVQSNDSKLSTHSAVLRLTLPSEEKTDASSASGDVGSSLPAASAAVQAPMPGHPKGGKEGKKKRRKVRRKSTRDRPFVGFGYLSPGKLGALLSEEETRAPLHANGEEASSLPARKRQRLTGSIACELNNCRNDPDEEERVQSIAVASETATGQGQTDAEKDKGKRSIVLPELSEAAIDLTGSDDGVSDDDVVPTRSASAPRDSKQKVYKSSTRTLRLVEEPPQRSTSQTHAGSNATDMTIGEWSGEWTPKKKALASPQEKKTPIAQYDFDSSVDCLLAGGTEAGPLDPRDEEGHLTELAGDGPGKTSGCADPTDHELGPRRTRVKWAGPMQSSHDEGAGLGRPRERVARCEGSEQQDKMPTNRGTCSPIEIIDLASADPTDHEVKGTIYDSEELTLQAPNAASLAGTLAHRSKRRRRRRPLLQEAIEMTDSNGRVKSAEVQFESDSDPWKDWREDAMMTSHLVGPLANAEVAGRFGMEPEEYERLVQAIFAGSSAGGFRRVNDCLAGRVVGFQADSSLDLYDDFREDESAAPKYTDPISPKQFSVSEYCDATDYVIYMALSEKRPSTFQDCLDRACLNCHERFVEDCLAPTGARYIPLATVHLTPEQVRGLRLEGGFDPMFLRFVPGWYEDDGERSTLQCSLRLDEESHSKLRHLLSMIDGLPPCDEDEVHCDRLPLFAASGSREEKLPYDVYEELRNLRRRSYGFFCAYGASVRIKEADAEFVNCKVLRNAGDAVRGRKRDVDAIEAPPGFRGKSSFRNSSYPLSIVAWSKGSRFACLFCALI